MLKSQLTVNLRIFTKELKRSVRSAHTTYQARLKAEKLEEKRKRELKRKLKKRRNRPNEYRKLKMRCLNQDIPSKIVQIL